MTITKRSITFWVLISIMTMSAILFLLGQTTAVFNYEFAVGLGLQEDIKEVGAFGMQINRAFGASDTLIYIPLIIISIIGLSLNKRWAILTSAAVMGISAYWATTAAFIFLFLEGVPGYSFVPGPDYWSFVLFYVVFGLWGLWYLIYRGEKLIN